jgi:hypothetical protein
LQDDLSSQETVQGHRWFGAKTLAQVLEESKSSQPSPAQDLVQRFAIIHPSENYFFDFADAFIEHSDSKITVKKNWFRSSQLQ